MPFFPYLAYWIFDFSCFFVLFLLYVINNASQNIFEDASFCTHGRISLEYLFRDGIARS